MSRISLQPESRALGSFNVLPNSYFGTFEVGEKAILMLRSHPFTQIHWIFNALLMIVLILLVDLLFGQLFSFRLFIWMNVLVFVGAFAYAWYNFLIWYYTVGFVTNQRVIDLDYYGIVKRKVTQAPINKIADVTARSSGFFRQVYNYGDVNVQTEGIIQDIEFLNVPDPDQAMVIIENCASGDIS